MKMRVLILGAGGFVGRRIVLSFKDSGWAEPVAAIRGARADSGVETVTCHATYAESLARACAGVDAVVNGVAGSPQAMIATARALQAVQASRSAPLHIVHFSSMAVYGDALGDVTENHPLAQLAPASYGGAKLAAEAALAETDRVCILRPGCIYGRGSPQWSVRIARLLAARRLGDLGPYGDGCSNLVHVDDVVAAVGSALRQGHEGCFNLAMPNAPTWNTYFMRLARAMGAVPVRRIPAWQLAVERKLLAPPLKIWEIAHARLKLPSGPPVMSPALMYLWQQDIRLRSERATNALALAWTPLQEGLADSWRENAWKR
ncbi:NAD-dependent epimerase/dehydratase family protein [Pigmentiphaga daeguensis]|uniref:NAD-dependent epimerase/dehydratase family protein n=1 Tax=Pigmentiphaga daeguensis TaxID=414049 RepID=A0ABN1BTP5_9BURK